jgi:hypothetical protein
VSFTDYVTAMQATRVCQTAIDPWSSQTELWISGIYDQGYNWQVPFVKCDSRKCEEDGQDAQPFCEYAIVAVSPSSETDAGGLDRAETFIKWVNDRYPALTDNMPFEFEFVQLFDSPGKMDDYVKNKDYGNKESPKIAMGIVWDGNNGANYVYSLRQNSTNFNAPEEEARPASQTTPDTKVLFKSFAAVDDACVPQDGAPYQGPLESSCTGQYLFNGVLTFQRLIGDFIMEDSKATDAGYFVAESGVQFVQFPTRAYEENGFFADIETVAPLLIVLGLLYSVAAMIGYVVSEKELRQKELMKMMSVTESDIGWSWFVSFYGFYFVVASITAGVSTMLYEHSDGFLLWIFWVLTFLASVVFVLFLATITSKSVRAVLIGLLLFLVGVFLTLSVNFQTGKRSLIALISLHPIAAFSYGLQEIGRLEDQGVGLTSNTVDYTDSPSGYTFNTCIRSLIFDCILWGIASWYLNRVIRPDYGLALPLWFPFTKQYWCPSSTHPSTATVEVEEEIAGSAPFEPVSDALKKQGKEGKGIEIHKLRKVFGDKTAVDDLSLSMYSGQITGTFPTS